MRTRLNTTLYILIIGFIFSIVVFSGAIYYTYKTEENLVFDFEAVEETHEVINELKRIASLEASLEDAIKGYKLSLDSDFLGNYNVNSNLIIYELDKIEKKQLMNDLDKAKISELCKLLKERIKLGREEIEFIKERKTDLGYDRAKVEQQSYLKIQVSNLLSQNIYNHQKLLHDQQQDVANKLKETHLTIKIVGISAFILSLLIVLFFYQYNKTHNKIESDLIELNENKNKFFSIISHDLRGPVKNIVLMAQLLHTGQSSKTIDPNKIARMIESSANNLSALLDNLLKWSRLQMNKIDFQPEVLDLRKLTDDVISNLVVHADQKNISVSNNVQDNTLIFVDHNMIATVIRNLISNSLKFTHKGGLIEVYSNEAGNFYEVTVKDNGVGMPQEIADKIFAIDFKHTTKGTNKEEGTGLGLKLCKEFIEKNNGKIWIESKVNEGSKFIFSIPAVKNNR